MGLRACVQYQDFFRTFSKCSWSGPRPRPQGRGPWTKLEHAWSLIWAWPGPDMGPDHVGTNNPPGGDRSEGF